MFEKKNYMIGVRNAKMELMLELEDGTEES